ncbi:MAG: hypothetical protein SGBAC_005046 [Bacillariaceae sp.]
MNDLATNKPKTLHIIDDDSICEIRNDCEFKAMLEALEAKWLTNMETKKRIFGFHSVVDGGSYTTQSINTNNELSATKTNITQGQRRLTRAQRPVSDGSNVHETEQDSTDEERPEQRKRRAQDVSGPNTIGQESRPRTKVRKANHRNATGREAPSPIQQQTPTLTRDESIDKINSFVNTALEQHEDGSYDAAIRNYRRALPILECVYGGQHAQLGKIYYNIGSAYSDQRLPKKALLQYEIALNIQLVSVGEVSHIVADTYGGIASAYDDLGDHEKAIEAYEKALKIFQGKVGLAPFVAHTFNNIGLVLQHQFKYNEAIEMHKKARQMQTESIGERHENFATTISHFGCIFHIQGKYDDALVMHNQELKIRLEKLGDDHLDVAETYNSLGNVLKDKGDFQRAMEMHRNALRIRMKNLDEDHPSVAETYNNMGVVWNDRGKHNKAISAFRAALKIQLKTLSDEDPHVADTHNNLGCAFDKQGKHGKAIEEYTMALEIQEKVLGHDHEDTAKSYFNLGGVYHDQHNNDKAMEMFRISLEIQLKLQLHEDVADTYNYMGFVYKNQNKYDEAMKMHKKALEIQLNSPENDRSAVSDTRDYMDCLLKLQSRDREALEQLQAALSIRQG